MLELFFDLLIYTIPETTGRTVVSVVTFNQVKCEEGLAKVIGVAFWLIVFVLISIFFVRL